MKKLKNIFILFALLLPSTTFAETADKKDSPQSEDKIDLKKLEDKYWGAQDSDFTVIQNRTYSKAGRYFLSLGYGPLINDEWSVGRMTNFAGGYYFNEKFGVELAYEQGKLTNNDGLDQIKNYNGLNPNFNKFVDYISANFIWSPIYAKMSFMDTKIMYFDMQVALGLGQMTYEQQLDPLESSNQIKKTIGYNLDFTQQFFFSNHFAVRVDVKNKFTKQDLARYRVSGSSSGSRDLGSTSRQDTSFLIGFTYFH